MSGADRPRAAKPVPRRPTEGRRDRPEELGEADTSAPPVERPLKRPQSDLASPPDTEHPNAAIAAIHAEPRPEA